MDFIAVLGSDNDNARVLSAEITAGQHGEKTQEEREEARDQGR